VVKQPEGRHIYDPNDPITGNGGDYYAASPFHGYWGYDFDQIDPHLHSSGVDNSGWEDFGRLVDALHSRGMKLMLDVVTNHGHPTAVAQSSQTFDKRNEIIMDGQTWVWETQDPYYTGEGDGNGFFSYENGTWLIDLIDFNENGENNAREHLFNVYKKVHRLTEWTPSE
jgi:glycosidase